MLQLHPDPPTPDLRWPFVAGVLWLCKWIPNGAKLDLERRTGNASKALTAAESQVELCLGTKEPTQHALFSPPRHRNCFDDNGLDLKSFLYRVHDSFLVPHDAYEVHTQSFRTSVLG
eukprot:4792815-Amphidinium_carterae.1